MPSIMLSLSSASFSYNSYFSLRSSTSTYPTPSPSFAEIRNVFAEIFSAKILYLISLSSKQSFLLKTTIRFLSSKALPLYCMS